MINTIRTPGGWVASSKHPIGTSGGSGFDWNRMRTPSVSKDFGGRFTAKHAGQSHIRATRLEAGAGPSWGNWRI